MSTAQWIAVIKIKVPTGGQSSVQNAVGNWYYESVKTQQIIRVTVPDMGGFFPTKAGLENVYGQGTVLSLSH
jgi:hypothetical protein